jgi:hypothetical protein
MVDADGQAADPPAARVAVTKRSSNELPSPDEATPPALAILFDSLYKLNFAADGSRSGACIEEENALAADPYQTLGVKRDASQEEIQKTYRRLAKKLHPDQSADEQVRLRACQWWTSRRMGWKETSVNEQVGKDGGPIETKDVSAIDIIRARIAILTSRVSTTSTSTSIEIP